MREEELAAELQATKDDASEWGDAQQVGGEAVRPAKRRLAAMVSVRLSPEELEMVQRRAAELGESVSGYLRGLALRDAAKPVREAFEGWHLWLSVGQQHRTHVAYPEATTDGRYLLTSGSLARVIGH